MPGYSTRFGSVVRDSRSPIGSRGANTTRLSTALLDSEANGPACEAVSSRVGVGTAIAMGMTVA
jgi:hypothetical protein